MGKKKRIAMCEYCKNLIAIGEGDYICCECDDVITISNYTSTKNYLKCSGRKFKKIEVQKCS